MNSELIVKTYEAKLEGQPLLFPDDDYVLRNTEFKFLNPEFDKESLIHWWMNVYIPDGYGDEKVDQKAYRSWDNAIWKYFKYARPNGYHLETNQSCIHFYGYLKEKIQPQIDEVKLWVPHIKPFKNREGREGKRIHISEHTLSQYGSWDLWIYSDNDCALGLLKHGHYSEPAKFDSIGKSIWFITQHHYYGPAW